MFKSIYMLPVKETDRAKKNHPWIQEKDDERDKFIKSREGGAGVSEFSYGYITLLRPTLYR